MSILIKRVELIQELRYLFEYSTFCSCSAFNWLLLLDISLCRFSISLLDEFRSFWLSFWLVYCRVGFSHPLNITAVLTVLDTKRKSVNCEPQTGRGVEEGAGGRLRDPE